MCGIVGILGDMPVAPRILDGLKKLEYRGYDSAGVATVYNQAIYRKRAKGKLFHLAQMLGEEPIPGNVGIGHTRWATHGSVNVDNAHPHSDETVAIVHNGIIENSNELKKDLIAKGITFTSETDTEVVMHLVSMAVKNGLEPLQAVQSTLPKLKGYFSLVFLFHNHPNLMIGARRGSPLILGIDEREAFLASDTTALALWSNQVVYLEDNDVVVCSKDNNMFWDVYDAGGNRVNRNPEKQPSSIESVSKGEYAHYMLKEIFEQPKALTHTYQAFIKPDLPDFEHIHIVACGTSYYMGCIASRWFEEQNISVARTIASEFEEHHVLPKTLYIFVSQSGETIDTLNALLKVKRKGFPVLSIVNVKESPIARQSDFVVPTQAGPEIGVASTKASTAQLLVFYLLAQAIKGNTETHIESLPGLISQVLDQSQLIRKVAESMIYAHSAFYLGRGQQYPVALEAALKLKEISYIHAEGFGAGELKHGPIALIDSSTPVIIMVPSSNLLDKMLLAIEQVHSRGACIVAITDKAASEKLPPYVKAIILPTAPHDLQPFLCLVASQMLAYYTALLKGTDVDQPRNLAKSVTVE